MQRYIVRRLLQGIVLLFCVAIIVFALGRLTGNPTDLMLPEDATPEDRERLTRTLGLDRPYHEQLYRFLAGAVRGDLGQSIRYRQPTVEIFFDRLPNTLKLVPIAIGLAVALAIPLGVISAVYRGSLIDRLGGIIAVLGAAMPSFWLGIGLIYFFSVYLGVLPSARMGGPEHYILPAITLGTFAVAGLMRLVRSSMLEILDAEFVKLARIKGLSEWLVIWKHCLRNAMIPVLSLFGVLIALLVTGAIVTETVFGLAGCRSLGV